MPGAEAGVDRHTGHRSETHASPGQAADAAVDTFLHGLGAS
jgi:hypothetical protein